MVIKIFRSFIFCISFCYLASQEVITFVTTSGEEYDAYYEMGDNLQSALQIDGGYIAVGSSREPVPNGGDILILKIDNYGNKIWTNSLIGGDDPHQDAGYDILHSNDGGYVVGGDMYYNGAQGTDAVLIKTDDGGNEVWRNYYGGSGYEFAYSTTKTTDGN